MSGVQDENLRVCYIHIYCLNTDATLTEYRMTLYHTCALSGKYLYRICLTLRNYMIPCLTPIPWFFRWWIWERIIILYLGKCSIQHNKEWLTICSFTKLQERLWHLSQWYCNSSREQIGAECVQQNMHLASTRYSTVQQWLSRG
jgi:hypothetical protein